MTLKELKQLAESATAGPWNIGRTEEKMVDTLVGPFKTDKYRHYKKGVIVAEFFGDTIGQAEIDAEYVAAISPETILKLLEDRERLIDALEDIESNDYAFKPGYSHEERAKVALEQSKGSWDEKD